ncbi:hypothetical protein GMST_32880 [Geomonas silvestris]|uniref:Uncharacterized protein n=1 Tax=Geomonas silvestris TaxID=2740184 RepID=A0A6V8MML5_9BACT|nr:hypothetical protein [Geomonas silvestris]GFO60963.1 hypothetical protein GMST_32880 [Geomonas silvestris]
MTKQKVPAKITERGRKGGAPEKVDLALALDLRLKGLSYQVIADHFDCSKSAVIQRLKPYVSELEVDTETYIKNRAGIIANRQAAVLAELTSEKLQKAGAKDLAIVFGTLYDKERLERGQSTANVGVMAKMIREACETGDLPDCPVIEVVSLTTGNDGNGAKGKDGREDQ